MSEKASIFEYIPTPHHLGMAAISLVFQPSDKLAESIGEFVEPDKRSRFNPLMKSDKVKNLYYTGGDADGLQYQSLWRGETGVSDHDWLYRYKRGIDAIQQQSIPVAAYQPRLEMTKNGGLWIELALLPDDAVKQKIGKTILRHIHFMSGADSTDEIIYARTLIPRSILVSQDGIEMAQASMMQQLGIDSTLDDNGSYEEMDRFAVNGAIHAYADQLSVESSPKSNRMFVKTAFVSGRPVS